MSHQEALTLSAPVRPERLGDLRALVRVMAKDPASNAVLPFGELSAVHFARILIVDGAGHDATLPADGAGQATLVVTLDCDAPGRATVRELVARAGPGLDELFGHCAGYPDHPGADGRLAFLQSRLASSNVFYVHAVGRTLPQIRGEARLRAALETFVDGAGRRFEHASATQVREALQSYVGADAGLAWALRAPAKPALTFRIRELLHKIAVPLVLVLLLPLVVLGLLVWVIALRRHEHADVIPDVELNPARMRELGDSEDFTVQNSFTSLAPLKEGRFWGITSRASLLIGDYTARHVFTRGSLSGLTTVHFARFMTFGPDVGNRALLFTSYYDGSLESYNNDFVDQVAWVLNTVFGQQQGYPRTRWLINDGAHNERGFKNFIRGHQIPTDLWYAAYPDLAAVTLDQNATLRAGLSGPMTEEEAQAWLRLL